MNRAHRPIDRAHGSLMVLGEDDGLRATFRAPARPVSAAAPPPALTRRLVVMPRVRKRREWKDRLAEVSDEL